VQQRSQNPQQSSQAGAQVVAELIEALGRSICLTIEVFLHRGFGSRYVGCGFLGMAVIFVFAKFFPGQDVLPLYCYMAAYGVLWLITAVSTLIRCWRGKDRVHSRYTGRPYLWRLLPNWKEMNVKHLEALAVILLGFGVHYLNPPLGYYLMMAASLVFLRGYSMAVEQRTRAVELNDMVIEEKLVADQFRDMQER
jgi:hypothetical protein